MRNILLIVSLLFSSNSFAKCNGANNYCDESCTCTDITPGTQGNLRYCRLWGSGYSCDCYQDDYGSCGTVYK